MKLKLIAAALALSLAPLGSAHAAMANSASGNGSLILGLIDPVAQVSAAFDLGLNMDDFLPGNARAGTWNLRNSTTSFNTSLGYGNAWNSFVAAADRSRVQWVVFATDSTGTAPGADRYLTTTTADLTNPDMVPTNAQVLQFAVAGTQGMDVFINFSNDLPDTLSTHRNHANGANIATAAHNQAYLAAAVAFGENGRWANTQSPFVVWAGVDTPQPFYMITTSTGTGVFGLRKASVINYPAGFQFALNYDTAVLAAVPEPETYAMMLAGLGLVGYMVARRRKQQG